MKMIELTVNVSIEVPDDVEPNDITLGIDTSKVTVFDGSQVVTHAIVKGYETTNAEEVG